MQYSIVRKSEVEEILDCRMDAEYWHPDFVENSKLVSGDARIRDFVRLDISNIKSSPIHRDFEYLEISRISLSNCAYETVKVPLGEEPDRAHHILHKGDVVVSTVRPNRNAVAFVLENGIVGSSGLSVLRSKNIESEYLLAFCKTNYFVQCLMRANKASMYPAVSNADVLDTPLFVPSVDFRLFVVKTVRNSLSCLDQAQHSYKQAEGILLAEMGVVDWRPKHCLSFVKNYSDTKRAGRMDAEYFQPKYEEIIHAIQSYSGGYDTLGNLCATKRGSLILDRFYDKKQGTPYIRGADFSGGVLSKENIVFINEKFSYKNETKVKQNEVVFSLIGSVGETALVTKEFSDSYISNNTGKITCGSKINPFVLQVLLYSIIGKMYFEKHKTQTAQPKISDKDVHHFVLPILAKDKQIQIRQRVAEAFALRKRSKHLLKCAKRAVELAIEQDEQAALAWLKSQAK